MVGHHRQPATQVAGCHPLGFNQDPILPQACPLSGARAIRQVHHPPSPSTPVLRGRGRAGQGRERGGGGGGKKEQGLRKPSLADRGEIGFSRSSGPAKSTSYRAACTYSTFISAQLRNFINAGGWRHLWAWPLPAL